MFGSIILDLGYLSSIAMVIFCPMDSFYLGLIVTFGLRCSFHLWLLLKRCFTVLQMGVHRELASRVSDIFNLFVRPVSCFLPHSPWPQALPLGLLSPRPPQPPPCSHSSVQQSPCLRSKSCPLAGVEPLKAKQRDKSGQSQRARGEPSHKDQGWSVSSDSKCQEVHWQFWNNVHEFLQFLHDLCHRRKEIKAKVHSRTKSLQVKGLTSMEVK